MSGSDKQVRDFLIIQYNSLGISLAGIAERLGCHHTTVTARLKLHNIKPVDTRHSFMEAIFNDLSKEQQEWLTGRVGPATPVKDFVKSLIIKEFLKDRK